MSVPYHPLNLYLLAEADTGRDLRIDNQEDGAIPCPPCASLNYTETRFSTRSGKEFLSLLINGSSAENVTCRCSVVVAAGVGFNETVDFTLTVDYSGSFASRCVGLFCRSLVNKGFVWC